MKQSRELICTAFAFLKLSFDPVAFSSSLTISHAFAARVENTMPQINIAPITKASLFLKAIRPESTSGSAEVTAIDQNVFPI